MKLYERVISDFGGYEKCKDILNQPNIDFIMNAQGLREHMLEYRRQHNIYEAGDLVVMADADDYDTIFKVIGKPKRLYHLQGNDDLFYGRLDFQIRHATDAEIEAGKRLEVS